MSLQEQVLIVRRAIDDATQWIKGPARGRFPAVDVDLRVRARKTIGAAGREALRDFYDWCIENEGCTPATANRYVANLWQAVIATGGAPLKQIERPDLTVSSKNGIRAALRQFAVYARDPELAAAIENKRVKRLLKDRRNSKPQKLVTPLDDEKLKLFLGALRADKGNPRRPWAWPCISIMVKLGLRASSDLLMGITKQAVADATNGAPLVIVGKRGTRRVVPSSIVREELEMLDAFPFDWNLLMDLVAPSVAPETRGSAAYSKIRAAVREYAESVDIDPAELHTHKLRHTAAVRLYEASGHDIMLVAAFLGHNSVDTTKRYLEKDRVDDMEKHLESLDFGGDE